MGKVRQKKFKQKVNGKDGTIREDKKPLSTFLRKPFTPAAFQPEYLSEKDLGSTEHKQLEAIVESSFLDQRFRIRWKTSKVQTVTNKRLEDEYEELRKEWGADEETERDMTTKYGFAIENDVSKFESIVANGLVTSAAGDSSYHPLGSSLLGVYVCKHADVCLRHASIRNGTTQVMRLIIFKYTMGRLTTAIPRTSNIRECIEPTQGCDAHVSVLPANVDDVLQTQFDRSQVYSYEIDTLLFPSRRPRQVCPLGVLTFTADEESIPPSSKPEKELVQTAITPSGRQITPLMCAVRPTPAPLLLNYPPMEVLAPPTAFYNSQLLPSSVYAVRPAYSLLPKVGLLSNATNNSNPYLQKSNSII